MERWCWPCETPNVAGLLYTCLVITLLGAWISLVRFRTEWPRIKFSLEVLCLLALVSSLLILAATGSRAGWLALLTGLAVLKLGRVITFKILIIISVVLFIAVLAIPASHPRLIQDPTVDSSIAIRLRLWQSTAFLIKDHPWSGVGFDSLMTTLDRWYLPEAITYRFDTALNDGLTLAGSYGIVVFSAVGSVIGAVIVALVTRFPRCSDHSSGALVVTWMSAALLAVILICGQFQSHLWSWKIVQSLAVVVLICFLVGIYLSPKTHNNSCGKIGTLLGGVFGALFPSILVLLIGYCGERPRRLQTESISDGLLIHVEGAPVDKIAVIVTPTYSDVDHYRNLWLYPLMIDGWALEVKKKELWSQGPDSFLKESATRIHPHGNVVAMAWGDAAAPLVSASFRMPIIVLNPEGDPPGRSTDGMQDLVLLSRFAPFVDVEAWQDWGKSARVETFRGSLLTVEQSLPVMNRWLIQRKLYIDGYHK